MSNEIHSHQLKHNLIDYVARNVVAEETGCRVGFFINTHDDAFAEITEEEFYPVSDKRKIMVIALNSCLGHTLYRVTEYDGHELVNSEKGNAYI